MLQYRNIDLANIKALLCDADGNLFPSEEPAFVASAQVTNSFMRELGLDKQFTAEELRLATTGKNFRTTAVDLAVEGGVLLVPELAERYNEQAYDEGQNDSGKRQALTAAQLERWVAQEKQEVTAYLGQALAPDPGVVDPLSELSQRFTLAAVSSSATSRLAACFDATGLAALFPENLRFSAEDSLPKPTSKPDPAIYLFAAERLGINSSEGLAIEDSATGAKSAVAAGIQTIGNIMFVAPAEQEERVQVLRAAGVCAIISSWQELADFITSNGPSWEREEVAALS